MNGVKVGNFGVFKDRDLRYRLSSDNLYDQIDANGWVTVYFGGDNVFLPGFGDFNVHITCDTTFFWDVVDEYGNRTKDGFEYMQVAFNPNMEPHTGDIIPKNPTEVFDYSYPIPKMICSNLWFYSNLFRDEYYRYNLIIYNRFSGIYWPDESGAKILPMNENVTLEDGDYIVGYRPKPEYMNQLAVVRRISSGKDNAIMFKFKVDLEYLGDNPTTKRSLRIFSMDGDNPKYMVYPENVSDIDWSSHKTLFMDEYYRYLLYHGIQEYSPTKEDIDIANSLYMSFMEKSNLVLQMDKYNFNKVAYDIDRMLAGENPKLVGYSYLIIPTFLEWVYENINNEIPSGIDAILRRVVLTTKYFKGFFEIDKYLGLLVSDMELLSNGVDIFDGYIDIVDGNTRIADGGENEILKLSPDVKIVMVDGIRQFEDGYIPTSAKYYRYPPDTSDYVYAGDIGNGLYKISIAGQAIDVFCDMDNGGWMYLIVGGNDISYIGNFSDVSQIADTSYYDETRGIGWGSSIDGKVSLSFYDMPFNSVKMKVSGDYNNPDGGTGYLEVYTGANGGIIFFTDDDKSGEEGQSLIVDGELLISDDKTDLIAYDIEFNGSNDSTNNLLIKMGGDSDAPYCRRYVKMLAIK
jgi:hypothetical protein